ncbi:PspC domain-containing protein [Sphingomonas sinipercae]|uniref:PspC domain-containing protein n=1 Tax=Sphingomonas sinipercae TaxID=2714944 RepID=A0A6G7ZKF8_9SPHN|nr:PspC domain-containing protein [Sphingomonas sinipercae]QIL01422.1 PspC domain-containing protein [Sphingomonas sinipercae]
MARAYSLARHDKKLAGVCSTLGNRFGVDPTFVRLGFAAAAVLVSFQLTLLLYVGIGVYFSVNRRKALRRDTTSEFDRMAFASRVRPSVHAMRTELEPIDRRMMAIDHHLLTQNDELAREIEALREDK